MPRHAARGSYGTNRNGERPRQIGVGVAQPDGRQMRGQRLDSRRVGDLDVEVAPVGIVVQREAVGLAVLLQVRIAAQVDRLVEQKAVMDVAAADDDARASRLFGQRRQHLDVVNLVQLRDLLVERRAVVGLPAIFLQLDIGEFRRQPVQHGVVLLPLQHVGHQDAHLGAKCRVMAEAKAPIDVVGTGSFLPSNWTETYATADIVEYDGVKRVKVGREFLHRNRPNGTAAPL